MWANMALLFCLSLIPVATEWVRTTAGDVVATAAFGVVSLMAALAYTVLVRTIIRANGKDSLVGTAIHADLKGNISLLLYAVGIALSPVRVHIGTPGVDVSISFALYVAVAVDVARPRPAVPPRARRGRGIRLSPCYLPAIRWDAADAASIT